MKKSILKLGLMVFFGMATVVALNSCSGGEKAVDQTEEAAADSADEGKKCEEGKCEEGKCEEGKAEEHKCEEGKCEGGKSEEAKSEETETEATE